MNTNKMILEINGTKIKITCVSTGHPLDEVVRMLFKGLQDSGCMKA